MCVSTSSESPVCLTVGLLIHGQHAGNFGQIFDQGFGNRKIQLYHSIVTEKYSCTVLLGPEHTVLQSVLRGRAEKNEQKNNV